jgi:hypothetical protein
VHFQEYNNKKIITPQNYPKFFCLLLFGYLQIFLSCQQLIATTIAIDILIYPQMSSSPVIDCSIADFYNSHATGLNSFRQFEEKVLFDAGFYFCNCAVRSQILHYIPEEEGGG